MEGFEESEVKDNLKERDHVDTRGQMYGNSETVTVFTRSAQAQGRHKHQHLPEGVGIKPHDYREASHQ